MVYTSSKKKYDESIMNIKEKNTYFKNLAVQAQHGDEASYRELLLALADVLRPFILKHTFNRDNTEDILQEVLMAVHKALHTYNKKYSFITWSYAICRYKIVDYIRKYQKISLHEIKNDEYIETFVDPDTNTLEEGFDEVLENALNNLPEKQKNVVTLLKLKDYSIKEVSKELKISIPNVKTTAHRAYKALRKELQEKAENETNRN